TTIVLAVETSFPTDPVTVTQEGQTSTLRFSGTLTGGRQFSGSRGAPLSSTMSGTMRINARGGQLGAAGMTMAMEQRTSLQLTDGKLAREARPPRRSPPRLPPVRPADGAGRQSARGRRGGGVPPRRGRPPGTAPGPDPRVALNVLVVHGVLEDIIDPEWSAADYGGARLTRADLGAAQWDYVALGGYHVCHEVAANAWYPGSLEYVNPRAWVQLREE